MIALRLSTEPMTSEHLCKKVRLVALSVIAIQRGYENTDPQLQHGMSVIEVQVQIVVCACFDKTACLRTGFTCSQRPWKLQQRKVKCR